MKKTISLFLIFWLLVSDYWLPASAIEYILAPNDQLEVRIIGQKDLDTKQNIAPDGTISLPLLGRVTAQGQTLKSLMNTFLPNSLNILQSRRLLYI